MQFYTDRHLDNWISMLTNDPLGIQIKAGIQWPFSLVTLAVFPFLSHTNVIKHLLFLRIGVPKWLEMADEQTNSYFCPTNNYQEEMEVLMTVGCCSIRVF